MKNKKTIMILSMATLLLLSLSHTSAQINLKTELEQAKKAIVQSNEVYFQAFVKNDASLLTGLYAEDCWIMPPNAPSLCGPDAPADLFRKGYGAGIRSGKRISIDVFGISDGIVAEVGFWRVYDNANNECDDGKFIVLWKKTPKGWKMWRESFNSNRGKK